MAAAHCLLFGWTAIAVIYELCSSVSTLSFLANTSWILSVLSHDPVMSLSPAILMDEIGEVCPLTICKIFPVWTFHEKTSYGSNEPAKMISSD